LENPVSAGSSRRNFLNWKLFTGSHCGAISMEINVIPSKKLEEPKMEIKYWKIAGWKIL